MEAKAPNTCVVCKETSDQVGLHYTRLLCNGCRAFFKRTVQGKVKVSGCKADGQCVVDISTRKLCKACRFEACQRAGVDSTKVQQPKDDSPAASTLDQQFGHGININNNRLMPSASSGIQSAFQPYYLTAQGSQVSQNMCAIPPVIDFHSPLGIGLFTQNLTTNFGSHQVTNPHAFNNSQLPVHCSSSSSTASNLPMQTWAQTFSGGFLPGGYSSMESNNRLTSTPSSIVPCCNPSDTASSSTFAPYTDMANMASRLFYNSNPASAFQYSALSYADLFHRSASALAHHASFSGARSLASPLVDRHRINKLDFSIPVPFHDSGMTSQADSYSLGNIRQGMIRSLTGTVPFSADAQIKETKHEVVDIYQRDTCTTQTASRDIKQEHDFSCNDSECCPDCQDSSGTLDHATIGRHARVDNNRQQSPVQHENKHLSMDSSRLLAASSKNAKATSGVHASGKSSAFMIDMLLKPQEKEMWTQEDERVASGQYSAPSLSFSNWQDDKNTDEATAYQCKNNDFKEKTCKKVISDDTHSLNSDVLTTSSQPDVAHYGDNGSLRTDIYTLSNYAANDEPELRTSTPNHPESERSLGETLEDVHVYDTDEDIEVDELKSNHESTTETCFRGNSNSNSLEDASKGENKELTTNKCCSDGECIVINSLSHQTNSSLGLNQSQAVSSGDSGLGASSHAVSSGDSGLGASSHAVSSGDSGLGASSHGSSSDLQQSRPGSVDHVKADETAGEAHHINKENEQVTPPRKRRLSLCEESIAGSTKKVKLNNHSFTATSDTRNYLRDIPQHYGNNMNNDETSPRNLPLPVATSSDSSSEDEATTRDAKLCPQFTSTPIEHAKINKSRCFFNVICDFAKYCQMDDANTPEEDACTGVKHSPNRSSPLKDPSSPTGGSEDSFEGQPNKLERLEKFQEILMRKMRSLGTYTMAEFKADALKLNSLAQDALKCEQLKF